jgi:hypothetical protein
MSRLFGVGVLVLLFGANTAWSDEVKGKVKSVDADKSTITVTVDDKDQTFTVAKDAKVYSLVGKNAKKAQPQDIAGGLKGVNQGVDVTLTTEKKDTKETVTAVKVEGLMKKKKNKIK